MYAPPTLPAPTPRRLVQRALPALWLVVACLRRLGGRGVLVLAALLWTGAGSVSAAPAIPAALDVGRARIAIVAPITGQYVVLCQEAAGPSLRGPWALQAGDVASLPIHALGAPCWAQASETRAGELMSIWETPRYTVWRAYAGMVGE